MWFPEDAHGEPHPHNPSDGHGGGRYRLEYVRCVYYTSDGEAPNDEGTNVLEGQEARDMSKCIALGSDWQKTNDLIYHEFRRPLERGGCGGQWAMLETKLLELEEPCWAAVGQLWGMLHPDTPRREECTCACAHDAVEHEAQCACECAECVDDGSEEEDNE